MKYYYLNLLIILLLIVANILAGEDSLLVKVGPSGISVSEFKQRFELVPQVIPGISRELKQKKEDLLYSLIAEKLWSLEAEELNLDTTDVMRTTFKTIEKLFVRDALYKIEIIDKIRITDDEKVEGLKRIYTNLILYVIQFSDSSSASIIYAKLKGGISFDSAKVFTKTSLPAITVKYGEFKESVEDIFYDLEINEFTDPIRSSSGWLIFKLLTKEPVSFPKRDEVLKDVEEIIIQRKIEQYYNTFYKEFFSGKEIETNRILFLRIAEGITNQLQVKKTMNSIPDSENVYLDTKELLNIEQQLGQDTLNMQFIKFDDSPITVKQFSREFIFDGFYSADVQLPVIASKLNSRVKTFIERELLAREGYKRGLQNLPEVKSSIAIWKDNYLAKILKNMLIDSVKVTDAEVQNYYQNKNFSTDSSLIVVNIQEILTDSLEVIESVIRELEKGADFRVLASLHTKRSWTRNSGGEFGFFPSAMYGDIGRIAATMKVGDIYGPIKLEEGYSLFTLIGRRSITQDSIMALGDSKEEIRKNLAYKKLSDFFIDYTVKLAEKYGVTINEELFRSIKVADLNLLVYRYLGFGGRISAVPLVLPFNEWFLPWKEGKKVVP